MTFFGRKNRKRRFAAPRAKTASVRPAPPITPPGKGSVRLLMTVVFGVAMALVLNYQPTRPLRVGDVADRTYRARVNFEVPDYEGTRPERERVKAHCPRVFTEARDGLVNVPKDLEDFLNRIRRARDLESVAPIAREEWGISVEGMTKLREELDKDWLASIEEPVKKAADKAAGVGIMDGRIRRTELDAGRYEFAVPAEGEGLDRVVLRSLADVLEHPGGLMTFFKDELREVLEEKSPEFREMFVELLARRATPTLELNLEASETRQRQAVESVEVRYRPIFKGAVILKEGDRITGGAIEEIRAEAKAFEGQGDLFRDREGEAERIHQAILRAGGATGLFLIAWLILVLYVVRFTPHVLSSNTRVFGVYLVALLSMATLRVLQEFGINVLWSPIALAAMVLCVACGHTLALGAAAVLAILAGVCTGMGLALTLPLLAGGTAAVLRLQRLRSRTDLIEAGMLAAVVQIAMTWVVVLAGLEGAARFGTQPYRASIAAVGSGLLAGFVMTGLLPYVERLFDVATDLRLLEWTDQNQPLLRRLAIEAPGSYHHSTLVSNLAEAAAEAIGANALLARTGGYLHDVGKLVRPEYYIENTAGRGTPHDRLTSMMSTLILTAHPKDGAELAREYGVPSPIRRIILEHHGSSLVQYFYDKARKEAESENDPVDPDTYRYRAPKPRSPESAIVMLADSCESAARSLEEASPSSVEKLVHKIVFARLEDGQLDDCRMSITALRLVEKSLARSLVAGSHPRIRYPAPPR